MTEIATLKVGIDARGAKRGAQEVKTSLRAVRDEAGRLDRSIDRLDRSLDKLEQQAVDTAKDLDKLEDAENDAADAGIGMASAIGALVGALSAMLVVGDIVEDLVRFERGLIGVGKTANIAGQELDDMGTKVLAMSIATGKGYDEILAVAAAAGQLGVQGTDNILQFTEAVIKLGGASGGSLVGDEAATKLARILNVTGEGTSKVFDLSNVIVALGNNLAATEGEIAHTATQVALATAAFEVSSAEAAALGGALAAVGVRAELSGSAIGRTIRMLDEATRNGGQSLRTLEQVLGRSADEIKETFGESPVAALQLFIEGLGDIAEQGGDTTKVLGDLGLNGEEILKVLPTLAVNSDLVAQSLALMNEQLNGGNALQEEAARAADSLGVELQRIGAAYAAAKQSINGSNGAMQASAKFIADTAAVLLDLDDASEASRTSTEAMAIAIKALAVPSSYLAVTALVGGVKSLAAILPVAAAKQWLLNNAIKANPYVAAAGAIAAVVTAITVFDNRGQQATKTAKELAETVGQLGDEADRLRDLDLILERALEKGDASKQAQTYTRMISELEDAYIQLKKTGSEISIADLAAVTGQDVDKLKMLGKEMGSTILQGFESFTPTQTLGDVLADNVDATEATLPAEEALALIDKRIEELKSKASGVRLVPGEGFNLDLGSDDQGSVWTKLGNQFNQMVEGMVDKSESLVESVEDRAAAFDLERSLMRLGDEERRITIESLQIENSLRQAGVQYAEELAEAYYASAMALAEEQAQAAQARREAEEFDRMQQTIIANRVRAREAIEAMHTSLRLETHALTLNSDEAERMNALLEYAYNLRALGVDNIVEETEAYERQLIVLQDQQAWHRAAATIASTVGNEITDLTLGLTSFEDALQSIGVATGRAIMQKTVVDPLVDTLTQKLSDVLPNLFGSITEETAAASASAGILEAAGLSVSASIQAGASTAGAALITSAQTAAATLAAASATAGIPLAGTAANGAVIGSQGIIPMADGGLITGPTLFPMANNQAVLGGEAGTEAIMPLDRGPDGKLGVRATGGGGGQTIINMKVVTNSPEDFRASKRQIYDQAKRARA